MNRTSKIFLLLALAFVAQADLFAQKLTSSPYSRYGIGELQNSGFSQNFAMGGIGAAMQNDTLTPYFINFNNPAAYPYNRITTFELGLASNTLKIANSTESQLTNTATLSYIAFALPVYKWWGMGLGIKPFSGTGYNVTDSKNIDSIGTVNFRYNGAGGINQIYWGNGFRVKNFSFGANLSYLLGRLENTSYIIMPTTSNYMNTRTYKTTSVSSIYLDYGFQFALPIDSAKGSVIDSVKYNQAADSIKYKYSLNADLCKYALDSLKKNSKKYRVSIYRKLKEPIRLIVGGKLSTASDLTAKTDFLAQTYVPDPFGSAYFKDTLQNTSGTKEKIHIPLMFTAGIVFKKGDRFVVGAEYEAQQWSSYKLGTLNGGLKNSTSYKFGIQFLPAPKTKPIRGYFEKVFYRIGFRYTDSYLNLQNTAITEYAATIGFGFPVGRNKHMWAFNVLNIGLEAGQRGTTANNLIQENFFKVLLGVTINDRWFIKPKYD